MPTTARGAAPVRYAAVSYTHLDVYKRQHLQSKRKNKPFIAIDCGALSKDLAASELFGHVKGAFTGAVNDKKGQFELANGGTLFLDEIGNLSYEVQIKLLRALQERIIPDSYTHLDVYKRQVQDSVIKTPIKLEELPAAITDILKTDPYKAWTPIAAWSVKDGQKVYFQVDVKKEEENGSLKFDKDGKPVE